MGLMNLGSLTMANNVILWNSPNGVSIEPEAQGDVALLSKEYIKTLSPVEKEKIVKAFKAGMHDMAIEFAWNRAIKILDNRLLKFGLDFIAEMVGRDNLTSMDEISVKEKIDLAFELGMINKTGRMKLIQANETINHYLSRDIVQSEEVLDYIDALKIFVDLTKYILSDIDDISTLEFQRFRERLQQELFNKDSQEVEFLLKSPYFYIKTTIRTLLNLLVKHYRENNTSIFEKVSHNANVFIVNLWEKLFIEEKNLIGSIYSKAIANNYKPIFQTLSTILDSVSGYDFVPEITRSDIYRKVALEFVKVHYEMNNFYKEPPYAKKLANMGTIIPNYALQEVLRATILSYVGNSYGYAWDAEEDNLKVLSKVTNKQWKLFFSELIIQDQDLLEMLLYANDNMLQRWFDLVDKFINDDFNIKNPIASNIFKHSKEEKVKVKLKDEAGKALGKIIGENR